MTEIKKEYEKTISKIDIQLKTPSNVGNIKGELDSIPKDFATLDFPCDELADKFVIPTKKTKLE
jgi:hypothetical protein